MTQTFLNGRVTLHKGNCLDVLKTLPDCSVDSVVTDPPYHLTSIVKRFGGEGAAPAKEGTDGAYRRASAGFMGKQWDGGDIAFRPEVWIECLRILKPGGHLLAFAATRGHHRMACAIEDAGFEIRDMIAWVYGSGFPKALDVSKAIDKAAGAEREITGKAYRPEGRAFAEGVSGFAKGETLLYDIPATDSARQWQGFGTALKPALEPITVARKPLIGTVAANVLAHGTGGLNIDGCRIGTEGGTAGAGAGAGAIVFSDGLNGTFGKPVPGLGRFPANLIHDGSEEVLAAFPESESTRSVVTSKPGGVYGAGKPLPAHTGEYGFNDSGSAARFFYSSKADATDRIGSKHPTVKPVDLMQYLVRLVTPPGGTVLDPFAGTGTTGEAAYREGFNAILIEREAEYQHDISERMRLCLSGPDEKRREIIKRKVGEVDAGPLFGGASESDRGGAGRFTVTSQTKTNDWPDWPQVVRSDAE